MPPRRWGHAVIIGVLATPVLGLAGCAFGDIFRPAGPHDVVISYTGDSAFFVGDSLPFAFTVSAGGVLIDNPDASVTSSDTTVFALTAGHDSLIGVSNGSATLTFRLNDPMFTDSVPTRDIRIRVRGGP